MVGTMYIGWFSEEKSFGGCSTNWMIGECWLTGYHSKHHIKNQKLALIKRNLLNCEHILSIDWYQCQDILLLLLSIKHWLSVKHWYCQSKVNSQKSNNADWLSTHHIANKELTLRKVIMLINCQYIILPIKSWLFRKSMMQRQSVTASTERLMQGESQLRFACF